MQTKKYSVKAFGITKEILGQRDVIIEAQATTVAELRHYLVGKYPQLVGLKSLFIAVNNNYADEQTGLKETDEIALIPPVSGG